MRSSFDAPNSISSKLNFPPKRFYSWSSITHSSRILNPKFNKSNRLIQSPEISPQKVTFLSGGRHPSPRIYVFLFSVSLIEFLHFSCIFAYLHKVYTYFNTLFPPKSGKVFVFPLFRGFPAKKDLGMFLTPTWSIDLYHNIHGVSAGQFVLILKLPQFILVHLYTSPN